jgi:hypothetical protein
MPAPAGPTDEQLHLVGLQSWLITISDTLTPIRKPACPMLLMNPWSVFKSVEPLKATGRLYESATPDVYPNEAFSARARQSESMGKRMPVTSEELTKVEGSIAGAVKPVLTMLGATNPVTASVLFGVSVLFRFLRLGAEIRKAIDLARKELDATVRSQGIFRVPISAETSVTEVLEFFTRDATFPIRFPVLNKQFAAEIEALSRSGEPRFHDAIRTLTVVMRVLPDAVLDRRFDNSPLLDDLFGKWLDPSIPEPDYRSIVAELRVLAGNGDLSLSGIAEQPNAFIVAKLRAAGASIDAATDAKLAAVNAQIRTLLLNAFLDPNNGVVKEAVKFTVDRRVELIQKDIDALTARKAELEAKAAAARTDDEKKELAGLTTRITELTVFQTKVKTSMG